MTVPDYQTFMRPLLAFGMDGKERNINDAINALADEFKLTQEERNALQPSGKQTILANRVHWARTYLDKAGALKRTRRSHFVVTDRGRDLLKGYPSKIDVKVLKQFPEFVAFQAPQETQGSAEQVATKQPAVDTSASIPSNTPEEMIQQAESAIFEALRGQLVARILDLSPTFFEQLVIDLIVAMGYGGSRQSVVQRLGKSGDGGIDGLVNEDPLGLDVVYVQAKRYALDHSVSREQIQQFSGALTWKGASKGVFVTTSSYTKGAIEFAREVTQRIILIDGAELSRLMIRYGVGVRTERVVELKRIDLDYFEEIEE